MLPNNFPVSSKFRQENWISDFYKNVCYEKTTAHIVIKKSFFLLRRSLNVEILFKMCKIIFRIKRFFYQHSHFVFLKKQKLCWVVLGKHNKSQPQKISLRRILLKINRFLSISNFVETHIFQKFECWQKKVLLRCAKRAQ